MFKIEKELGTLMGHTQCKIYNVVNESQSIYLAVDWDSTNGETMEAWESDEWGYALDPKEKSLRIRPVYKELPDDIFELIGFEED